jgi:taurine transport system permease protein
MSAIAEHLPEIRSVNPAPAGAPRLGTLHISLATLLALLLAWWGITAAGLVKPLFLPGPAAVFWQFIAVLSDGYVDATLGQHLVASLVRVFSALVASALIAVPIGFAIGLSRIGRGILDPLLEILRPIPPLAYLPLVIIWFGIGEVSKVLVIGIAMLAPIAISTASAVRAISSDYIEAARLLGASEIQVVRRVIFPTVLPNILTGIRIALGAGWSTLVAAELIAATRGVGFMIQSAAQFLVTDVVIMGILVIAGVAFLLETLVRLAERILVPWGGKI